MASQNLANWIGQNDLVSVATLHVLTHPRPDLEGSGRDGQRGAPGKEQGSSRPDTVSHVSARSSGSGTPSHIQRAAFESSVKEARCVSERFARDPASLGCGLTTPLEPRGGRGSGSWAPP
jgi:hypothetical protein